MSEKKVSHIRLVLSLCTLLALGACGKSKSENAIQIKGSDTEVNLVQALAEKFMASDVKASLAVTGGGSGTGIAALINQKTDIANSSRAMKDEEIERAKKNGVNPVAIPFALDGLAIIVHPSSKVDSLSLQDLAGIFSGKVKNWKELGGADLKISIYGRQSNSGTYVFFRDNVVKGEYSPDARQMNGNAQIVEAIKKDKSGIGYVGLGYVVDSKGTPNPHLKIVNVSNTKGQAAVSPLDLKQVLNGSYPLTRPLYQYTNGIPKGKLLAFIQFELSEEGQKFIQSEGYYPVSAEYMKINQELGIVQ